MIRISRGNIESENCSRYHRSSVFFLALGADTRACGWPGITGGSRADPFEAGQSGRCGPDSARVASRHAFGRQFKCQQIFGHRVHAAQ